MNRDFRRILIVEDDTETLDTYARSLTLQGYQVWRSTSGEEAWHEIQTKRPDAVLVDLQLPGIDGLEFLRRLRASEVHRHVPAALVTGDYYLDQTVIAELERDGIFVRFKPIWLHDLDALVDAMFKRQLSSSA